MKHSLQLICLLFFIFPVYGHNLDIQCPHQTFPFQVEVAKTPLEKARGLMFRTSMGDAEGMLFLYARPEPVTMWMKNTLISLDMLFCDEQGHILAIYEKAKPLSLDVIGPVQMSTQVLEIKGGTVKKQGITTACTVILNR